MCGIPVGAPDMRVSCSWDAGIYMVRKEGVDVSLDLESHSEKPDSIIPLNLSILAKYCT